MIPFPIKLRIGLSDTEIDGGMVSISRSLIHNTATFAGSRHVLQMGGHFRDYVEVPHLPAITPSPFFSPGMTFRQLKAKERSPDVTGNIGEAVVAIVAGEKFKLADSEICHLQVRSGMATPDYLLRFNANHRKYFRNKLGMQKSWKTLKLPAWIPAESKSCAKESQVASCVNEAFRQLVSYWDQVKDSPTDTDSVGFGMIACMKYLDEQGKNPKGRRLQINFFAPKTSKRHADLIKYLKSKARDKILKSPHNDSHLKGYLHDG